MMGVLILVVAGIVLVGAFGGKKVKDWILGLGTDLLASAGISVSVGFDYSAFASFILTTNIGLVYGGTMLLLVGVVIFNAIKSGGRKVVY